MTEDPIALLEGKQTRNEKGMEQLFRESARLFQNKNFDVQVFEKYSTKIRSRNQFKPKLVQEIGKMFTFQYRPVGYDTLPYFDSNPLIFCLNIPNANEVIGMNFHYLPPTHRVIAFYTMKQLLSDTNRGPETRLRLIYDIMKTKKRYVRNMVCIRKYKTDKIRSKVYEIDPKYWEISMVIPTQRFWKKKEKAVYMEVNREIRKLLGNL